MNSWVMILILGLSLGLLSAAAQAQAEVQSPSLSIAVAINELAWSGTAASSADEWIELKNNTDQDIDLTGWTLFWKEAEIKLSGKILANGFYLLERTDDTTVSDIPADLIYSGGLSNSGEALTLRDDKGNIIDTANKAGGSWPAGTGRDGDPPFATMERIDSLAPDTPENWATNDGSKINGLDAEGNKIRGTPKAENSVAKVSEELENKPPTADFTFSPENPTTQDTVQFYDKSHDPDGIIKSWLWDFGDGSASKEQTPSHRYTNAGAFIVQLTVTDDDGASATVSKEIKVSELKDRLPVADFIFSPENPTTEDTIQFTDKSYHPDPAREIVFWGWDFGDGKIAVNERNPTHKYAKAGTYIVKLTVIDDKGAMAKISKEIIVSEAPPAGSSSLLKASELRFGSFHRPCLIE